MNNPDLQSRCLQLLSLVGTIRHYEEALAQANGERFNLFDVLQVGHYEVRTHSPMLAELLNPGGSHGQGAVFLLHFLTELKIHDFDAQSARVVPEVSIGEMGRLDIEITNRNNRRVVIENKIYAGLQEKQLGRYHKHDPKANLLFLTLRGEPPADWSTNPAYKTESFSRVFQCVSYRTDIVRWLEACRKEVATAPSVREAITQYIHLIQRLTLQNTSTRMNQEIIKAVIKDRETYAAYASLRNAKLAIQKAIIAKVNEQLKTIGDELGFENLEEFAGDGKAGENYFYTTPAMKAQNLKFGLRCSNPGYREFICGFAYKDTSLKAPLDSPVFAHFKEAFAKQYPSNGFWYTYAWWDHHRTWGDETMAAIISGEFAPDLDALIRKLAKVAVEATPMSQTMLSKNLV